MSPSINGKAIMTALSELREPSTVSEIVNYVAKKRGCPREKVEKVVQAALDAGVRYGYLEMCRNYYYTIEDAADALDDDSDVATETESSASFGLLGKYCASNTGSEISRKRVVIHSRKGSDDKDEDDECDDDDDEEDEELDDDDDDIDSPDENLDAVKPSQHCSYHCAACRKRSLNSTHRAHWAKRRR